MGRCINWLTSITVQPCLSSVEQCWFDSKQSLDGYGVCIHEVMCKAATILNGRIYDVTAFNETLH